MSSGSDGKPVRLGSRDEASLFAESTFAELKKMGATMTLDMHATDCHATVSAGYCTVEFDVRAKMSDGSTIVQPARNTIVLRKGADGWKWTHWHSSLSAAQPAATVK